MCEFTPEAKKKKTRKVEIQDLHDSLHIKSFHPHWKSLSSQTQKPHRLARPLFFPTQCILANAPAGTWSLQPTPVFYDVETLDFVPKFGQRPGQIVEFKIVFIERAHGWLCRTELGVLPVRHHHAANLLDSLRAESWRQWCLRRGSFPNQAPNGSVWA